MPDWKNLVRRNWGWLTAVAFAVFAAIIAFCFRDSWASSIGYTKVGETVLSPGARFFRDFMIALAAFFGIGAAIWRNTALDRQSKAAITSANAATNTVKETTKRHDNERFAAAVQLMAQANANKKPAIAARIGGIHIMEELVTSAPERFAPQVIRNLVAYIKYHAHLTADPELESDLKKGIVPEQTSFLGEDVKAAFAVIDTLFGKSENGGLPLNLPAGILNFSHQNFSHLDLSEGQVSGLWRFKWEHALLQGANLSGANLQGAYLHYAKLQGANLKFTQLQGAGLCSADLSGGAKIWALLDWADLRYADLRGSYYTFAGYRATDLSEAKLDNPLPDGAKEQMNNKVWHCGEPEWGGVTSLPSEIHWGLGEEPSLNALIGTLRNFAEKDGLRLHSNPAQTRSIRKEARQLLLDGKLPENFPENWREWLMDVSPDGSHPNDNRLLKKHL